MSKKGLTIKNLVKLKKVIEKEENLCRAMVETFGVRIIPDRLLSPNNYYVVVSENIYYGIRKILKEKGD